LIVQLGRPPVFEIQARLQAGAQAGAIVETVTIEPFGWVDPSGTATAVLACEVAEGAHALAHSLPARTSRRYADAVAVADAAARRIVRASLADGTFAEGHVVATVFERLPSESAIVLGNSLSVRVVDTYVLDADPSVLVLHQRGTSGIECNLALAYGAHRALKRTTTLLYGDVSLLHDLGSFYAVRDARHLVVVVLNNQGGRIFEQLPLARVADLEAEVFGHVLTPHSLSFEAVAPLASATYHRAEDAAQLHTALTLAYAGTGVHLVEVRLAPSGGYAQNAALWRAAAALP
jgi:2-succinyl-5-enolpyruvyl-6-hydroxy-3-cyclohexene-1-carboxylate synthase